MFEQLYEQLDALLSQHGIMTNVLLKSERSLLEEEEQLQMELYFAASDDEDLPLATIHLFPIDEETCEIEVEISFDQQTRQLREAAMLWQQAQSIVAEISMTEKKRYLSAEQIAEHLLILDYHFVVTMPQNEQDRSAFVDTLARFATDLGKLVRL
ncbi:hypothetical protein [Brevibacillus migulae]|uniref:hypothetical protein n=1 Tax=Brevibacillus migulae TaxID=1644114 RepID=UPI00106E92BC|nr:hypothetical protein [Brevibacillus migulae]